MEKIELLGIDQRTGKSKFVNLLKVYTEKYSTSELIRIYDQISKRESVIIDLHNNLDGNLDFHDLALELMELSVCIGYASFHEEGDNGGMQISQENN